MIISVERVHFACSAVRQRPRHQPPRGVVTVGPEDLARPAEPSWGRVLADTVKLTAGRRLRTISRRRPRAGGARPGPARPDWRLASLVLALAGTAVVVLWLTGTLTGTAAQTSSAAGPGPSSPVVRTRAQAAAWIAGQVSDSAIVACYPSICAALQERGVAAGRLMPLRSLAAGAPAASVLVTSPSANSELASRYAPGLIASFGSGGNRIEVRAIEPGGASAYRAALRADLAARRAAGSELLQNSHIHFTGPDAVRLRAGEVDSRVLTTVAALASRYSFRVTTFGDAAPGAPVLFREVTITGIGPGLPAALAMVRAQNPPYAPAHAVAANQSGLSVAFAVPSPLGLLSPVLDAGSPPPAPSGGALP
jgi:hypothetical protein